MGRLLADLSEVEREDPIALIESKPKGCAAPKPSPAREQIVTEARAELEGWTRGGPKARGVVRESP